MVAMTQESLPSTDRHRAIAVMVVDQATPEERMALREWAIRLLLIRDSQLSGSLKAREAIAVTLRAKVIFPAVKLVARKVKEVGWDNRSKSSRIGVGAAAVGMTFFSGQSAGIAAMGTAVGVPLWVVFAGGGKFAGWLIGLIGEWADGGRDDTGHLR